MNEIKMGILAKALLYPGASTLIMNLITSFSDGNGSGKNKEEDKETGSWIGYDKYFYKAIPHK